jgi:hypothetical protein
MLEGLRHRRAAVVVWGGRTEHRQVTVTAGSYESMRAEAMAALSAAGVSTQGVWADIAIGPPLGAEAGRRTVVISMASASDMADALHPLREAGIRLRTVTTPAVALGAIARWRPPAAMPGTIEPYVAFDEQVTCIALVRQGVLLAARDLPWGFVQADYSGSELRSGDNIATRLADAIGESVVGVGGSRADIGQVCLCGALPDLRSMSLMLMERLGVEVAPLSSWVGIDATRLPEPADVFRQRAAELRLAWAAAADWPPTINLLRARRRQSSTIWLARAAVAAGAVAGVSGSWWLVEHLGFGGSNHPAVSRRRAPEPTLPVVYTPPEGAAVDKSREAAPAASRSVASEAAPPVARPDAIEPPPREEAVPLEAKGEPFDATLRTILFSQARRLAMIDDRVVGVGDEVRGATVIEITAAGVVLRDTQGRLRRLTLGAGAR